MSKIILFVDDEPWFVEPLVESLKDNDYAVELAKNGSRAIEKLEREKLSPDLIILDIIMPTGENIKETNGGRRTGLKVHEIIRKKLELTTPIIFLTVVDDPSVEREILSTEKSQGINNYALLVKPVLPTELLDKVTSMLKK